MKMKPQHMFALALMGTQGAWAAEGANAGLGFFNSSPAPLSKKPYEPGCFPAGTLVHTKEGLRPIEQIEVGDWVLSKNESGDGERDYKRVTKTFVHEDRQVIQIAIGGQQADGSDKWNYLAVTPEHPIWVQGKGWKDAEKLKVSWLKPMALELLSNENPNVAGNVRLFVTDKPGIAWVPMSSVADDLGSVGSHLDITSMTTVETGVFVGIDFVSNTHRAKPEHLFRTTVYNIEVEDFHTYYVGEAGVWVHNKNVAVKPEVGGKRGQARI